MPLIKSSFLSYALLFFLALPQASAWAKHKSTLGLSRADCRNILTKAALKDTLSEFKLVRAVLKKFLKDSTAPQELKNLFHIMFTNVDLSVKKLTPKRRKQWNVDADVGGYAYTFNNTIEIIDDPSAGVSWNSEGSLGPDRHPLETDSERADRPMPLVVTPEAGISKKRAGSDASTLVHEVAHTRFEQVLMKNFKRIAAHVPESLMRVTADGRFEMDEQFYAFLHERVATYTEFIYVQHALEQGYQFESLPFDFSKEMFNLTAEQVSSDLAQYVVRQYKITKPEITILTQYTIAQILTGRPWKKQGP